MPCTAIEFGGPFLHQIPAYNRRFRVFTQGPDKPSRPCKPCHGHGPAEQLPGLSISHPDRGGSDTNSRFCSSDCAPGPSARSYSRSRLWDGPRVVVFPFLTNPRPGPSLQWRGATAPAPALNNQSPGLHWLIFEWEVRIAP
jgi:hypothetical protein